MADIRIRVEGERAINLTPEKKLVTKNEGYSVEFEFDGKWSESAFKMALFIVNEDVIPMPFSGNTVEIPMMVGIEILKIGVKANDIRGLQTTTSALVKYELAADDGIDNEVEPPKKDIYDIVVELQGQKGQPNGIATLDENGKVPKEQLPNDIAGGGGSLPEGFNPDDYVKFTDYPTKDDTGVLKAGVVKVNQDNSGMRVVDGELKLYPCSPTALTLRTQTGVNYNETAPITAGNLNIAVIAALTDNKKIIMTDEEKAAACETIGAATKTEVELLSKALVQSGTMYKADTETEYTERVTADGLNVLDGSKAVLKKVVGSTVACKNLVDIPFIDGTMAIQEVAVNFTQNIFVSVGELATVSSSIWRFQIVYGDGTSFYAADKELVSGGKLFKATADNPIVKVVYRGDYVTEGRYSKIMIAYGDTATAYQPYFTGLKSASFGGIESGGKNLFNPDRTEQNLGALANTTPRFFEGNKYFVGLASNNYYYRDNVRNFIANNGVYSFNSISEMNTSYGVGFNLSLKAGISYCYSAKTENTKPCVVFYDANGNYIKDTALNPFTIPENCKTAVLLFSVANGTKVATVEDIQVEEGTTATEYTPYIEPTVYTFPKTEMPLGKTIDFENKKITDYGVDLVLTGTENWRFYTAVNRNGVREVSGLLANNENYAQCVSTDGVRADGTRLPNTIGIGQNNAVFYWYGVLDYFGWTTEGETYSSEQQEKFVTDFKAWLAQRYADGNPVKIRYVSSVKQSETDFIANNEYTAWLNGMEKVKGNGDTEYGANNTLTQNYILVKE